MVGYDGKEVLLPQPEVGLTSGLREESILVIDIQLHCERLSRVISISRLGHKSHGIVLHALLTGVAAKNAP